MLSTDNELTNEAFKEAIYMNAAGNNKPFLSNTTLNPLKNLL
jgi:hypothetical protein